MTTRNRLSYPNRERRLEALPEKREQSLSAVHSFEAGMDEKIVLWKYASRSGGLNKKIRLRRLD